MAYPFDEDILSQSAKEEMSTNPLLQDEDTTSLATKDETRCSSVFNDDDLFILKRKSLKRHVFWLGCITILALTFGLVSSGALLWHHIKDSKDIPLPSTANGSTLTCGNSMEEARSLGCKLDPMVYSYTPPACYNESHSLQFFNSEDWPFWSDHEKKYPIPPEDILSAKHEGFYSTWAFHGAHCQYLLTRNLQVLPAGGPLNDYMLNDEHNYHCFKEVRHPSDMRKAVRVGIHFSKCVAPRLSE